MRQKSLNENIKAREQSRGEMTSNIDDIDELLDDEGWDILNSLTEDELSQLNSDFDPENMLIPTGERVNHERHIPGTKTVEQKEIKPMFSQTDLKKSLDAKVAQSQPVIKNEKIRQKEEDRKRKKEEELDRKFKAGLAGNDEFNQSAINLTEEEEELLAEATEEELIEAAALLNMNDILTSEQINAVFAGDKPVGGMSSNVKGTLPKQARINKNDEETDLDIVVLNRHLKEDSEALFYLCVNNQPKLERQTLELIINAVATSTQMKHLSLSMIGLADKQCILLAEAISKNHQIETVNLDSNIIGMPGIEALMNVVSEHPSLREVKVSNQKQPFGGQGEECMAAAIAKNSNILKFGYSFKQAAPRNKVDRAIIRNNEIMRQKRRNGEETYDLKAVCKIRDPWPQPWIRIKGQRLLGSQLETKVTDMGLMIDVEAEVGRESRGPKVREEREAKPLDIAALLAARANKLKGSKVADLEKESEERRKKTLMAMQESEEASGRVGTMLKKSGGGNDDKQQKSLNLGNNEAAPPSENEKKGEADAKKKEEEKAKKEADAKAKKEADAKAKKEADEKAKKEKKDAEEKAKKEAEEKAKKEEEDRKAKEEEEKKQKEKEEAEKKAKEEEENKKKLSDLGGAKKIASLAPLDDVAPVRRRRAKPSDDEEEPEFLKPTEKKEEPKEEEVAEKPLSAAEEGAEALKERREALAAKKAGLAAKTEEKTDGDKPLSAAERAKALRERREALAAKKAGADPTPTSDAPLSAAEEGAGSLKERREELAKKKAAMGKPEEDKPKVDIASSLATEDKPLSLKERRALLAEKKRQMGK